MEQINKYIDDCVIEYTLTMSKYYAIYMSILYVCIASIVLLSGFYLRFRDTQSDTTNNVILTLVIGVCIICLIVMYVYNKCKKLLRQDMGHILIMKILRLNFDDEEEEKAMAYAIESFFDTVSLQSFSR